MKMLSFYLFIMASFFSCDNNRSLNRYSVFWAIQSINFHGIRRVFVPIFFFFFLNRHPFLLLTICRNAATLRLVTENMTRIVNNISGCREQWRPNLNLEIYSGRCSAIGMPCPTLVRRVCEFNTHRPTWWTLISFIGMIRGETQTRRCARGKIVGRNRPVDQKPTTRSKDQDKNADNTFGLMVHTNLHH